MGDSLVDPRMPCYLNRLLLVTIILTGLFGAMESPAAEADLAPIQAAIRARLEKVGLAEASTCRGEPICGFEVLPLVYRGRDYLPFWIDISLRLHAAEVLDEVLHRAAEEGLMPADYHTVLIDELLAEVCERLSTGIPIPADWWADLELMLSDAFLLYSSHLVSGRVNPETLYPDWKVDPGNVALIPSLIKAATTADVEGALNGLRPAYPGYAALRQALVRYRAIAKEGGWPILAHSKTLRRGDRDPAVEVLRQRLILEGDLGSSPVAIDAAYFDDALMAGIRRFQKRHGLDADGVVGPDTVAMLRVPAAWRVRQLTLNLERWRWLPHELGSRFIIVNTADFNLKAVASGEVALQMRVVVGRPARRSPVFSAEMTYLEINPYWNVPTTIAVEDMLPEIKKDTAYLTRQGIRVYENWTVDALELDPTTVDWQLFHTGRFPFKLRQDPGPYNALGRIKFMFANEFAVYLHDTPERTLFDRAQRDLSSGCVRVEAPLELAAFVLEGDPTWTPHELMAAIQNGTTTTIDLRQPLPVHLIYMTAWVDESGGVQFRSDIYNRDGALDQALNRRRPTPLFGIFNTPSGPAMANRPGGPLAEQ